MGLCPVYLFKRIQINSLLLVILNIEMLLLLISDIFGLDVGFFNDGEVFLFTIFALEGLSSNGESVLSIDSISSRFFLIIGDDTITH